MGLTRKKGRCGEEEMNVSDADFKKKAGWEEEMNVSNANFIQKKDSVELSVYGNEAFEEEQTKN